MTKAEEILKNLPSVKIGLDDHYGRQTVLNALNKALYTSDVVGRSEQLSKCEHPFDRISGYKVGMPYCNKCRKSI